METGLYPGEPVRETVGRINPCYHHYPPQYLESVVYEPTHLLVLNFKLFVIENRRENWILLFVVTALKTTYHVFVRTGNKMGAGTDANVYVFLYGEIDDTGQLLTTSTAINACCQK